MRLVANLRSRSVYSCTLKRTRAFSLKRDLRAHSKCIELGTDITGIGSTHLLSDVAMQVIEHESDVSGHVPIQTCRIDGLLSTSDTVHRRELIVEIDHTDASGNLPSAPGAATQ